MRTAVSTAAARRGDARDVGGSIVRLSLAPRDLGEEAA
jgi:hypothetical protein